MIKSIFKLLMLLFFIFSIGCAATTGPSVSIGEIEAVQRELQIEAVKREIEAIKRVNKIGVKIREQITKYDKKQSYYGIIPLPIDDKTSVIYNIKQKSDHAFIVDIDIGSPADKGGLKVGDIIKQVRFSDNKVYPNISAKEFTNLPLGTSETVYFIIEREGVLREFAVTPVQVPDIYFKVSTSEVVNAFASGDTVTINLGMLRFIESDDELALIMGHEVAHITEGHIAKGTGAKIGAILLGVIVAGVTGYYNPYGADVMGQMTARGVYAPFSQGYEMEADYVGLKYAYMSGYNIDKGIKFWYRFGTEIPQSLSKDFTSTHPSSPERLVKARKTVDELHGKTSITKPEPLMVTSNPSITQGGIILGDAVKQVNELTEVRLGYTIMEVKKLPALTNIFPSSIADKSGLKDNDVVKLVVIGKDKFYPAIDYKTFISLQDEIVKNSNVIFTVNRGGKVMDVEVKR